MIEAQCINPLEHYFHNYDAEVVEECDGKTKCGEQTHQPHSFLKPVQAFCHGVCKCGLRKEPHGPGAHK